MFVRFGGDWRFRKRSWIRDNQGQPFAPCATSSRTRMLPKPFREDRPFAVPGRMTGNSKGSDINGRATRVTEGGMVVRAAPRA